MTENEAARVTKLRAKIVDLKSKVRTEREAKAAIKAQAREAIAAAKGKSAKPPVKAKSRARRQTRSQPSAAA